MEVQKAYKGLQDEEIKVEFAEVMFYKKRDLQIVSMEDLVLVIRIDPWIPPKRECQCLILMSFVQPWLCKANTCHLSFGGCQTGNPVGECIECGRVT